MQVITLHPNVYDIFCAGYPVNILLDVNSFTGHLTICPYAEKEQVQVGVFTGEIISITKEQSPYPSWLITLHRVYSTE